MERMTYNRISKHGGGSFIHYIKKHLQERLGIKKGEVHFTEELIIDGKDDRLILRFKK